MERSGAKRVERRDFYAPNLPAVSTLAETRGPEISAGDTETNRGRGTIEKKHATLTCDAAKVTSSSAPVRAAAVLLCRTANPAMSRTRGRREQTAAAEKAAAERAAAAEQAAAERAAAVPPAPASNAPSAAAAAPVVAAPVPAAVPAAVPVPVLPDVPPLRDAPAGSEAAVPSVPTLPDVPPLRDAPAVAVPGVPTLPATER